MRKRFHDLASSSQRRVRHQVLKNIKDSNRRYVYIKNLHIQSKIKNSYIIQFGSQKLNDNFCICVITKHFLVKDS